MLAVLATEELKAHGLPQAILVPRARPLSSLPEPGLFNMTGSIWLPGFNRWYDADSSTPGYGQLLSELGVPDEADAVLEIATFEEFGRNNDYYIRLWMKLVDRENGNVMARALTFRGPRHVKDYIAWFAGDALQYKETVHVLGGAAMILFWGQESPIASPCSQPTLSR